MRSRNYQNYLTISIKNCNQQFISLWQIQTKLEIKNINDVLTLIAHYLIEPFTCELSDNISQNNPVKYDILKLKNGKVLETYFQPQKLDEKIVGRVWRFRDITAQEQAKALAEHKALHDTITELPKRTILTCQLSAAITEAEHNSYQLAVMFIDLDRFKIISDTLGHQAGDRLLKDVVQRLKACIQNEDLITRWGTDEFTILLPKIADQATASAIAQRFLTTLKSPFSIKDKSIYVNSHIGIAIYPEHGTDAETLLKNADAARSQAQQLLTLENFLHSALEHNEFLLYYQPIVNIVTGKIVKMEALLRWHNPQLGLVAPNIFIPLAEKNGSIIPIGEWVLKTACVQNKTWQQMGLTPIKISVNLSVRQFQQPNLVTVIGSILQQTQLSPSSLELEITESVTMQNTELAKTILKQLHEMGISLSMDDFGTGYSSLSYLKQFPFCTLKIDRSFVKDLPTSAEDIAIVDAVITLGQGLNLNVVAEGVETEELKELLKNLGCEYIQGYLFSKPLPAEEATKLLQNNRFLG